MGVDLHSEGLDWNYYADRFLSLQIYFLESILEFFVESVK